MEQGRRRRWTGNQLVRRLHVWTSMTSLVVMLFFGLTGILLNHEDWTLGSHESTRTATGTAPASLRHATGFDTLGLAQYVHDQENLAGRISGNGMNGSTSWVTYAGPGYTARVTADTASGAYRVTETRAGLLAALNDIHRAKNTGLGWRIVNDVAGALLAFIGVTGLLITWLSKARNRRRDLALAGMGLLLAVGFWWTALR